MASEDASARPLKRARSATSGLGLQVSKFDSEYQFRNAWFSLSIYVVDTSGQLKTGGGDVALSLFLECVEEDGKLLAEPSQDLLQIDPKTPPLVVNGRATLRCRITECSMNEGNQRFCIRVATTDDEGTFVRTEGVFVINHALKLAYNLDWPEEWYKDEGGRDKCITAGVELQDANGQIVTTRRVPLKVTLFYQTGTPVGRQDILKLGVGSGDGAAGGGGLGGGLGGNGSGSSNNSLCVVNGIAEVKARIDEVSRSHQGWAFKLRIGPDVANHPLDNDVSAVFSPLVTVRSKRNNRKKLGMASSSANDHSSSSYDADAATAAAAVAMMAVQYGNGGGQNSHDNHAAAMPAPATHAPAEPRQQSHPFQEEKPALVAASSAASTMAPLPAISDANHHPSPPNAVKSQPPPMPPPSAPPSSLSPPLSSDVASMQEALTSVLGWIDSTLKDVQGLKWQQLGHERAADGSADISRPLYSISNPNDAVDRILRTYEENVMGSLHTILEQLEPLLNQPSSSSSPPVEDRNYNMVARQVTEDNDARAAASSTSTMPPPLQRQVSGPYVGDYGAVTTAVPASYPSAEGEHDGSEEEKYDEDDEAAVSTIVAKIFVCKNKQSNSLKMGFPSFDKVDHLVGFYETKNKNQSDPKHGDGGGDGDTSLLKFRSLDLAVQLGHVSDKEKVMDIAKQSLESERKKGAWSVFAKANYNGDSKSMKDATLSYFKEEGGEERDGDLSNLTPGHDKSTAAAGDIGAVLMEFDI